MRCCRTESAILFKKLSNLKIISCYFRYLQRVR